MYSIGKTVNNKSISNLLMNKISLQVIATIIITSVLLISLGNRPQTFAEEKINDLNSVNDIAIKTIFHFRAGTEEIDTFKVISQTSGFIHTKSPVFVLQGVVDGNKPLLYEAADRTFNQPNQQHEFSQFDVDVYLHNGGTIYRHFVYSDCNVQNYWVDTEFDKEETYSGKTKFAIVDKFEFLCSGYELDNPVYEKILKNKRD